MPINWIMLYKLAFCQLRSLSECFLDQFPSPLAALILGHNHHSGLDLCLDAMKPRMTIWCDLCGRVASEKAGGDFHAISHRAAQICVRVSEIAPNLHFLRGERETPAQHVVVYYG